MILIKHLVLYSLGSLFHGCFHFCGLFTVCLFFALLWKLSYSTKFEFNSFKNKEKKGRISDIHLKTESELVLYVIGCTVGNPEKAHFQIMNHVAKPVVVWHGAVAWCLDKCIRRWISTSADIKIGNSPKQKFQCVFSWYFCSKYEAEKVPRPNTPSV